MHSQHSRAARLRGRQCCGPSRRSRNAASPRGGDLPRDAALRLHARPCRQAQPMKKISIISPCYNEEENVRACHEAVRALFAGPLAGYEREHIFADNASADATPAKLREIAAEDPSVKVILNSRNFGPFRSM